MKYLCLISAEKVLEQMSPSDAERHLDEYAELTESLRRSGRLLSCNRLVPAASAVTVRVRGNTVTTTDGPFAETKEQIGGYYVIEARDLNEAVEVATRIPGARIGSVEVRAIAEDEATLRAIGAVGSAPQGGGR